MHGDASERDTSAARSAVRRHNLYPRGLSDVTNESITLRKRNFPFPVAAVVSRETRRSERARERERERALLRRLPLPLRPPPNADATLVALCIARLIAFMHLAPPLRASLTRAEPPVRARTRESLMKAAQESDSAFGGCAERRSKRRSLISNLSNELKRIVIYRAGRPAGRSAARCSSAASSSIINIIRGNLWSGMRKRHVGGKQ